MSNTGNGAAAVALAVLVLEKTGSSLWVAATLIATHGVQVGTGILTSSLSDRHSRRAVMIVSELAGGGCYLAMAFTTTPAALLAIGMVASVFASPFNAASSAAMPNLVEPADLSWANSMASAGRSLGMTIGPALGGVIAASAGASAVFATNAVSFLLSAATIATVTGHFSGERVPGDAHRGVAAGLSFVWRDTVLRRMMFAEAILVLGIGLVQVARVPFAEALGLGSAGLGLLTGLWGAGLLVGSFAGRFLDVRSEPAVFVVGLAGVAVSTLAIGVSPWIGGIVVLHLFVGLADALDLVAAQGMRQRRAPDAVRSRVIAASSSVVVLAQMVGYATAGFLVDLLRPRGVYLAAGAVVAASAVLALPLLGATPPPDATAPNAATDVADLEYGAGVGPP